MQKSDDFPEFMTNKLSRGHPSRTGGSYYTTKRLWRRQFTCIDMHKNSKIQHSISLQKFDRVFANSNIQHFKCSKILKYNISNVRKSSVVFWNFRKLEMLYIRIFEQSTKFSKRNRVLYFGICMQIDARELSPPETFCCIIESPVP